MSETVEYFMWPHQHYVQIFVQRRAEELVEVLGYDIPIQVFLVGALVSGETDSHPVCVQPAGAGVVPEQLHDILGPAAAAARDTPGAETTRILLDALRGLLEEHAEGGKWVWSVGCPARVGGYLVMPVVRLEAGALGSYPALSKSRVRAGGQLRAYVSLLDAAVEELLRAACIGLHLPDPGARVGSDLPRAYELARRSGSAFMWTVAWGTQPLAYDLFEACSAISGLAYERGEPRARMVFASPEHPDIEKQLLLTRPVALYRHREVRKLLEMAGVSLCLLSSAEAVYAIGSTRDSYRSQREDLFAVEFRGRDHWCLLHADDVLMEVLARRPSIPQPTINEELFRDTYTRLFGSHGAQHGAAAFGLVEAAQQSQHGALLVFTSDAPQEAHRLRDESTPVAPVRVTPCLLTHLTAVDGAVLLSPDCMCHAVGAILDGKACPGKGDPARGSRYNSAIRYYEALRRSGGRCSAVVVSEDGTTDCVPGLRPRVRRTDLDQAMDQFERLVQRGEADYWECHTALCGLEGLGFYLRTADCARVNAAKRQMDAQFEGSPVPVRVKHRDLEPNDEMDETYYLPE